MKKNLSKLKAGIIKIRIAALFKNIQIKYSIKNCIEKSKCLLGRTPINAENTLARLKIVLQKEYDIDSYVKKAAKAVKASLGPVFVKLNIILHKEVDFDYYVKKSLKAIKDGTRRAYPILKTALQKEYDIDIYVKKALSSFGVFIAKCARHIIRAAAVVTAKAHKIFIGLSEFAASNRIIIIEALKQRRNNKVKARLDQERENIAFLTEFLNSLKADLGADISFSLVSVNRDDDSFNVIEQH